MNGVRHLHVHMYLLMKLHVIAFKVYACVEKNRSSMEELAPSTEMRMR